MQKSSLFWIVGPFALNSFAGQINVPADQSSIQAAIDAASAGDQILVAPGTYNESIDLDGKAIELLATGGSQVTTLQSVSEVGITCNSGEGAETIIDGFTVSGGFGALGSGLLIGSSSPEVRNCHFTQNNNQSLGGGVRVTGNGATPFIHDCLFTQNSSERGAGLGGSTNAQPLVQNCFFTKNTAIGVIAEGGGVYFGTNCDATLVNCAIFDNRAKIGGAVKVRAGADVQFENCTMAHNLATLYTGGLFNSNANPVLRNTVVWGNVDGNWLEYENHIHTQDGGITSVDHSNVEDGHGGIGNIQVDPQFVAAPYDVRPGLNSPLIDAGDNSMVLSGVQVDANGFERFVDDPDTVDTGSGDVGAAIVDIGAFEFQELCGNNSAPFLYCQAKTSALGCQPTLSSDGTPTASGSSAFVIRANQVDNLKNGLFFYGYGRASLPFQGGTLCVQPPLRRTPIQNAGGNLPPTQDCSGELSFDFDLWAASGVDPFLNAGQAIQGQFWYRDPADFFGVGLSAGIEFVLCP